MSALQRCLAFLAFLFCALALGPALAHLLELPNKLGLDRADYLAVQQIYSGWSLLGIVVFGALLSTLGLSLALRSERGFAWALAAFLCIAATQALFWSFTYPANVDTANWTALPDGWEALRSQWEWSHAASAVLNLAAVLCLTLGLLSRVPRA